MRSYGTYGIVLCHRFARFEEFILLSDPPGENVLTPDVLDYIYSIHQEVTALQVAQGTLNQS